jgi:hypothetical protein
MSESEAYHFEGTGIHWSMTEVASVAPCCLYLGSTRLISCRLTVSMIVEKRVFLVFDEDGLAYVLRGNNGTLSSSGVSLRKNVVANSRAAKPAPPQIPPTPSPH